MRGSEEEEEDSADWGINGVDVLVNGDTNDEETRGKVNWWCTLLTPEEEEETKEEVDEEVTDESEAEVVALLLVTLVICESSLGCCCCCCWTNEEVWSVWWRNERRAFCSTLCWLPSPVDWCAVSYNNYGTYTCK